MPVKTKTRAKRPQKHTSRPVKPVAALVLFRIYARARRSANSRHGPIASVPTRTAARRRFLVNAAVPRTWPRRPGLIARLAARATGTEPHPKENRLVAPRVASGRLSRRRRRAVRGRRERWAKRTQAFTAAAATARRVIKRKKRCQSVGSCRRLSALAKETVSRGPEYTCSSHCSFLKPTAARERRA